MNYGNIKYFDIADGPGVRTTIFVSGCTHHCPGCFQPETWDFAFGEEYTQEVEDKIIESLAPDYVDGMTLLGGEPMEKANQRALLPLVKNAGSIFLGRTAPEALGDYFAGPNHTLPTSGTARFSSPLRVDDFVKKSSYLYYEPEALAPVAERIADFMSPFFTVYIEK